MGSGRIAANIKKSRILPVSLEEFRPQHWQKAPLHSEGALDRYREMLPKEIVDDPLSLMANGPEDIEAWGQTIDGYHEVVHVGKDIARKLYEAGMTLFAQVDAPRMKTLSEVLAVELGRSPRDVRVSVFMTKAACSNVMHFDSSDTMTIQLAGQKTWTVAPAAGVETPIFNASPFWKEEDSAGRFSLGWFQPKPWPKRMPAAAKTYEMNPGSFLYVPSGWWHATHASSESLSLNILFRHTPERSWAGVMGTTVERLLGQDIRWRRYATGGWPDSPTSPTTRSEARELLAAAKSALDRLDPDDLMCGHVEDAEESKITETTPLKRRRMSYVFASNQQNGDGVRMVMGNHSNAADFTWTVSQNELQLIDWIRVREKAFCARDMFSAKPAFKKKEVMALLTMLVRASVLRRVD